MRDLIKELRTKGAMLLSDPPKPDDRLQAADEIERLRVELRHCINELRSDTSRAPHRIRRAALAEKVLHKKEAKT